MYRSRLARLEDRRNLRSAVILTLVTILLIVGVLTVGIPVLVRIAVFIGNASAGKTNDKTDFIPPGPPQIITSFEATNSAILVLAGQSEPGASVYLTKNKGSLGNVLAAEDGTFRLTGVALSEGVNTFEGVAVDQAGNRSRPAKPIEVFYSTKSPELTVVSPTDRLQITGNNSRVEVKGKVDPGVRVTVNDRVVIVGSGGEFSSFYNLNPGENVLVFVASNKAGNQTRKEIVVIYQP